MITDRDIVVRSAAAGNAPADQRVEEILTTDVTTCHTDEDARAVLERMSRLQVRRMPVVDRDRHLVGLVSLGDLAAGQTQGTEEALRAISWPAEPDRSGTPSTARADATRDARPSPLSDDERQELERRLARAPGPRLDAGRGPDPDSMAVGGTRGARDEDNVRAAFGIAGSPAGGGVGRMPGGLGGDGYNMYGEMFGPGEDGARAATLSDDVNHIPAPDAELDGPVGNEGGGPSTSPKPQAEDAHVGRVVFSSGPDDDAGQPGKGGGGA